MRRLWLMLCLVALGGCVEGVAVSGNGAVLQPPDPTLTCLTPTVTLGPGEQGSVRWAAAIPAPTTTVNKARLTASYPAGSPAPVTIESQPVTVTIAELSTQAATFAWELPARCVFVSGSVTNADASVVAIAAPATSTVTTPVKAMAAGQSAIIEVVVRAQ
jgi:hypothetical protein